MFICAVFDAAGDVGEKLVGDVRYDYPDGVRLAAAKRACRIVGLVVKLFGDLQNPLRRLFVDAVGLLAVGLVVHHERDQDSVRCLIVGTADGAEIASAVAAYPRWKKRLYCDPSLNRYRQHPLDYIESLEQCVREA